jgi:hypothetical protein
MPNDVMSIDDAKMAVLRAAWEWWRSKRLAATREYHLKHPAMNCGSTAEALLAEAVAEFVKAGGAV